MIVGSIKEDLSLEKRVALTPDAAKNIINLGIGQPDFKTPDHIVEAGIKALKDGHHGYTQSTGIPNLREAVSDDIKRRYNEIISPFSNKSI